MDTLQLSKNDFKFLLPITLLVPLGCFIAGLYVANSFSNQSSSQQVTDTISSLKSTDEDSSSSTLAVAQKAPKTAHYIVQAGVFSTHQNAVNFQSTLHQQEIKSRISGTIQKGKQFYRVELDSFKSKELAMEFLSSIKEKHGVDLYITDTGNNHHV